MKKVLLTLMSLCLGIAFCFGQNNSPWTPNYQYEKVMLVLAVVDIDGVEQYDESIGVATFVGDECRDAVLYAGDENGHLVYVLAPAGSDGDVLTFRLWNETTGEALDLESDFTLAFDEEGAGFDEYVRLTFTTAAASGYTLEIDANTWYLIASPIAQSVGVGDVTNLLENDYDLYYFDQSGEGDDTHDYLEWINYKQADETHPFTTLEPNKGYLYANSTGADLTFNGTAIDTAQVQTVSVDLDYDADANLPGVNLVGNPFAVNAIVDIEDYLVMTEGELELADRDGLVYAMEGIFVEAEGEEETVEFTRIAGAGAGGLEPGQEWKLNLRVSDNNGNGDLARIRFGQGHGLTKYMINPERTKIYFPMDNANYAVVYAENMGEMPVNFKAEKNGTYTMSFSSKNVEFSYLHLIDNMTGADVDVLANPSYSFEALTTDYASRFKLVFATGNTDDSFAFYSNGSFIISNEGNATLQVVDVTGRILKSETINGCASVNINAAPGVYMIRLVNNDNMKVQKVIVK